MSNIPRTSHSQRRQRGPSTGSLHSHSKNNTPSSSSSEADKFHIFEQWLRMNGAQFPHLELRKYETSPATNNANDGDFSSSSSRLSNNKINNETEENYEAEEKKDGGLEQPCESKGVAQMSIQDNSNNNNGQFQQDDGSKEMRGVHAKTTIPPQTICVSIPKSCLITVEMGQATPIGRKILTSDLELDAPKHIFLMIYLLWDKKLHGHKSFFAPYYDILPSTLRNMPIFWTEEELHWLTGSYLLVQIADRIEAIRDDYESIISIAPEFNSIATLQEFQWARMIVCSRNFGLLINGHRTSALVPHADMLNHYRPRETKWTFNDETQCFTITTLQSIQCGMEVYDSYGQKCNHRFLLNYGFCVENNVEIDGFCPNEVPLELGLDLVRGGISRRRTSSTTTTTTIEEEEEGRNNNIDDRECWEKKVAFWCRGESTAMQTYHYLYGGEGGEVVGGPPPVSASARNSSGFQALAAAVASAQGNNNTSSFNPSSTDSIMQTMASMNDAPTESALTEARRQMSQHPAAYPIKRVRVCVSNNENTRILFSMLRVLACNSVEIHRISVGGRLSSGGLPLGSVAAQRLFGLPTGSGSSSSSSPSSTSSSLRTCRDIRYPINLRNERCAMELLLEITARALSKYPTSLAQDTADLRDEATYPKYSNRRNAKLQVRGEKEVLHHFALWARTSMHVIDIILHELENEKKLVSALSARRGSDGRLGNTSGHGGAVMNQNEEELGYNYVIQAMEEDDDCHATILRYCSDILGAVRRDELNRIAANAVVG